MIDETTENADVPTSDTEELRPEGRINDIPDAWTASKAPWMVFDTEIPVTDSHH